MSLFVLPHSWRPRLLPAARQQDEKRSLALVPVPVGLECEREYVLGGELRMGAQERAGGSGTQS